MLPCWKATWTNQFWVAQRSTQQAYCNSGLVEIRYSIVHSVVSVSRSRPTDIRHIMSEEVIVPVLLNTVDVHAGSEVVLQSARREQSLAAKAAHAKRPRTRLALDEARTGGLHVEPNTIAGERGGRGAGAGRRRQPAGPGEDPRIVRAAARQNWKGGGEMHCLQYSATPNCVKPNCSLYLFTFFSCMQ